MLTFEMIKKDFLLSEDERVLEKVSKVIIKFERGLVLKFLFSVIKNQDHQLKNRAALILRQLKDNRAVKPLINAIEDPCNENNRGTLLYALQTLDCSLLFLKMVKYALFGNYEVQCMALNILKDQQFYVDKKQIDKAKQMIGAYVVANDEKDVESLIQEINKCVRKIEKRALSAEGLV